jgi:hypothetical protein
MESPQPDAPHDDAPRVVVVVVRSGGLAGLRKQWRAEPPAEEAGRWIALIDDCPWDSTPGDAGGADRYVWRISAAEGEQPPREAEVPDSSLDGPWRTLIDEVRAASPRAARR